MHVFSRRPVDNASRRTLLQETTHHLDASLSAIRDLDSKIEALARFNAILVGVIVAGISVWAQTGPPIDMVEPWILTVFGIGFATAVMSAAIALWAHLGPGMAVGLHPTDLQYLLDANLESDAITEEILVGYIDAIAANYVVMERTLKGYRLALSTWTLSIAALSVGALGLLTRSMQ